MKSITILLLVFISCTSIFAQESTSPYQYNWKRDGIWTAAALGTSAYGLHLIKTKDDLTQQELDEIIKDKGNINFLDKWVAGNNSDNARNISDIPFATSLVTPLFLLIDGDINDHSFQIMGLYLETIATTGAIYTITAGLANRTRPYVYSESASEFKKLSKNGQRSFYSGHVAATTTATFFAAKVYQDFHPDSKALPYIWAGAAVLPAFVGYFRLKAGEHFLTDVLLGYTLGALAGYYIPELHKIKKESNIGFSPIMSRTRLGDSYQGFSLSYSF